MKFSTGQSIGGRYKCVVRNRRLESSYESGWSNNIVTDLGVRMMLGGASSGGANSFDVRACCGSGNSTPLATNTQLDSFVAGASTRAVSNSMVRNSTVSPYYVKHTWTWRFTPGEAVGNISELGIANSSVTPVSSTQLFSRALVRDAAGNPTTITVQSDEYLDVTYELFIYPSASSEGTFSQMIDGVPQAFNYTIIPCSMASTANTGWGQSTVNSCPLVVGNAQAGTQFTALYAVGGGLGGVGGDPTGTRYIVPTAASATGNYAGKYRDVTFTAGLSDANATMDCYKLHLGAFVYQMQITPSITKTSTKTYTFTIRSTLDNTI